MKLKALAPRLMAAALLITTLSACGQSPPSPQQPTPPDSSATDADSTDTTTAPAPNWAAILGETSAPANWQVQPCDVPTMLCVEANSELVGTVERFVTPVAELNVPTDGSAESLLQSWVENQYETIQQDRETGDSTLTFTTQPPTGVSIGSLPGLRYGFTTTQSDGTLFDRTLGYVATDGEFLYVFATSAISGDPTGGFSSDEALTEFEPHFAEIVEGLNL